MDDIIKQIQELSNGTMATLTRLREYKDLEDARAKFLHFVIGAMASEPNAYENWRDAWNWYQNSRDINASDLYGGVI